ncbi:S53 family peptidase [Kutzneria chonburiensis]|uniref:Protease pro-enzyme activation domain-containing protein n=1 Tax=Kutzneria chonburiensis TaxID=1483604 RepID=A0ABV6MZG3_9PSEU|nr:S53 family peptidase [Kutzneria chonburiensis]
MPARVVLPGSTRPAAHGLTPAGTLDPSTVVTATVVLRRRAELPAGLVSGPSVIGRQELAARYGADPADVQQVRTVLSGLGVDVVAEDLASRRLSVRGDLAALHQAFGVSLEAVSMDGARRRHRVGSLEVPAELGGIVTAVLGLDDRPQARRPRADAGTAMGYTPPQLAKIYGFPAAVPGVTQTIAVIELGGGYTDAEISTYFQGLGVGPVPVRAVSVDGGVNTPGDAADDEVLLDIEVIGGLVPEVQQLVYFAPNTDQGFVDAVSTAVHASPTPAAVSISWGAAEDLWTEQTRLALDDAFADAAALGVTVVASSGDWGAADEQTDGKQHVDFPASSPNVLSCGGTSLTADASTGVISAETVWNNGVGDHATGGGVSTFFPRPAYQSACGAPESGRGVPDVAAVADPKTGYMVLVHGKSYPAGGTSAVAPLWSALVARLVQHLGRPLGLLQPLLYKDSKPGALTAGFRDVTAGDNQGYSASPGWDSCTGLGSPDGTALLTVLSGTPPQDSPP